MQICRLFLQHSETFDVSHDFLPLTIAELSTLKQVRFFGPPCTVKHHESESRPILLSTWPTEFRGAVTVIINKCSWVFTRHPLHLYCV